MFSLRLVFLLLVSLGQISCQSDKTAGSIPRWATGLIAVTVFLFFIFAVYMANKVWNNRSKFNIELESTEKSTDYYDGVVPNGTFRHHTNKSSEHEHAYENPIEVCDNVLTTVM